jgi:hypothetical protein
MRLQKQNATRLVGSVRDREGVIETPSTVIAMAFIRQNAPTLNPAWTVYNH